MVYSRNQPVATDDLDISQPFLVANTNASDDSFGVDHYKFSDLTVNNGFHNKVTTPIVVNVPPDGLPPVTTTNPIFYAFQYSGASGTLQFSRGPSNAVPTPLTRLQSPVGGVVLANGATTPILNYTSLPDTISKLFAYSRDTSLIAEFLIGWNSAVLNIITPPSGSGGFQALASGATLVLKNISGSNMPNVSWSLEFKRISF